MLNHQGDGEENPSTISKGGAAARSCGTTAYAQSISTSGSLGSPSTRSEAAVTTLPNRTRTHNLSSTTTTFTETMRVLKGRLVCEKVEGKGKTTYNEVADKLVAEFADPRSGLASLISNNMMR